MNREAQRNKQLTSLRIIQGIQPEFQTVWIQIGPDILSCLIWIQTVCQGYQQMILVGRVKTLHCF